MGEGFNHLLDGFALALSPSMLLYSTVGAFLGTVIGVLPGIGPAGAIALMLPLLASLDPVGAVIMLAAIYTGAMYGGSTSSILLNTPGDTAAVITCLDGHQMAKQGRAGPALCIAAIGSYIAGTVAVVGLMLLGPMVARFALQFSAPEYFALMVFGLTAVASLAGNSMLKALMAATLGLMIATVGTDVAGVQRFVFGIPDLLNGIDFLAITLGLFALPELLMNAQRMRSGEPPQVLQHRIYIGLADIRQSLGAIVRGGFIGFVVGALPGAGASIASFISYSVERQVSRHPECFGHGEIRGVAGPESANNAASAGAFVPMLSLGIPGSATTAVMLGAFMMLDIMPGPLLFLERPDVVWGLVAALYIGNIILLILNVPLIGIFVRILYMPMAMLLALIAVISVAGVYSTNHAPLDLLTLCAFGMLGYFMREHDVPLAPVILGVVLGGRMEEAFRQSMIMSQGDVLSLLHRPIVTVFLLLALVSVAFPMILQALTRRELVLDED